MYNVTKIQSFQHPVGLCIVAIVARRVLVLLN